MNREEAHVLGVKFTPAKLPEAVAASYEALTHSPKHMFNDVVYNLNELSVEDAEYLVQHAPDLIERKPKPKTEKLKTDDK